MKNRGRISVMQPYIFPYIGYFNLIQASELFVFYDDVHYIKQGWINRNKLLSKGEGVLFTVPVMKASSNRLIKEISPCIDERWCNKFYKQLVQNYKKSPFFNDAVDSIMSPLEKPSSNMADLAIESIRSIYSYLEIPFEHTKSSVCSPGTRGMEKADRLIEIAKSLGFEEYINALGGERIYSKEYFREKGVELFFIKNRPVKYNQYGNDFVPRLSIIDALMFCTKGEVIDFINTYDLE